ncbi:MAG: hypothetical protein Q8M92_09200 [Candidatus Subteraquimicrobiales bacterium]|nr:hypothetical protein [Candidatus Subteraquimicrobiales bacterium]
MKEWADYKISVRRSTAKRLKERLKYGDTMDGLITELLDLTEEKE